MANEHHLKILRQGVDAWNGWRRLEQIDPDLSGADLTGAILEHADLSGADLRGAILESARLRGATLNGAKLEGCTLTGAILAASYLLWVDLRGRNLSGHNLDGCYFDEADLRGAQLRDVDLTGASFLGTDLRDAELDGSVLTAAYLASTKLSGASLRMCSLSTAILVDADLAGADLAEATFGRTVLANLDLSQAKGLRAVEHEGPSSVGTDTLERTLAAASKDAKRLQDVEAFFRGAGVREHLFSHLRSRAGARRRFHPAYLVHALSDVGVVRTLYEELQAKGVRCWLDMKTTFGGPSPILDSDRWRGERVILCASAAALENEWIEREIAVAVSALRRRGRDGLLVVDLDGCLRDGWNGEHAEWLRQRVVADLGELARGEGSLEEAVARVVESLRTEGRGQPP